jgi:hypothetical protein
MDVWKPGPSSTWGEAPDISRLFIVNDIRYGWVPPDGRESTAVLAIASQACMGRGRTQESLGEFLSIFINFCVCEKKRIYKGDKCEVSLPLAEGRLTSSKELTGENGAPR